ncbi:hypothetical protein MMC22_003538 [Lobaria immixta]|nr:hypothetical protein [Lobaria immixta]
MAQTTVLACIIQTEPDQVREIQKSSNGRHGTLREKVAVDLQPLSDAKDSRSWLYHAYTLYLFTCNNLKDVVVLGYSFGVLCALCSPIFGFGPSVGLLKILCKTPEMLIWSWTHLLLFNIHNQRDPEAILEDAINKGWRPLPAKRLTTAEATRLMYAMYPVVILSSLYSGGLGSCLLEMFACLWYNEWRGAESPFLRNLLNGAGFLCFMSGPLEILAIGSGSSLLGYPRAVQWLALLVFANITTIHTQDFRDVVGDKLRNRRTIPLAIGDASARWLVVIGVILCSCVAPAFWQVGLAGFLLPASTGLVMVFNLLWKRTLEADSFTWKLWPVWITSLFFLPLIKMGSGTGTRLL